MLLKRSLGSAEIVSVDEAALQQALARTVAALTVDRAEICEVVLFGSHARRDYLPESDVDLLLVVDPPAPRFLERADAYKDCFRSIPLDVNVVVYTSEELEQLRREPSSLVASALAEGRPLFRRGQ